MQNVPSKQMDLQETPLDLLGVELELDSPMHNYYGNRVTDRTSHRNYQSHTSPNAVIES